MKYKIALYQTYKGYSVSAPGLPGCWSQGQAAIQEYLFGVVDAHEELNSEFVAQTA